MVECKHATTGETVGVNAVQLIGDSGPFTTSLTSRNVSEGVEIIHLDLRSNYAAQPGRLEMVFHIPCVDIYAV